MRAKNDIQIDFRMKVLNLNGYKITYKFTGEHFADVIQH